MQTFAPPPLPAFVPLALLESMRDQDIPAPDGDEEYHEELAAKRLGMSQTVAQQIERYRTLTIRGEQVPDEEVVALLRLAARRSDGALVFADAGRRVARHAASQAGLARRVGSVLPGAARSRMGVTLAGRVLRPIGITLGRADGGAVAASAESPPSIRATPDGAACSLYGSAVAEALRIFTDFDGAVTHGACRTRGDDACRWSAGSGLEKAR